jgi:hypothetical protein
MFVPRYSEEQATDAVASSLCYWAVLRKLGLRPAGGNHRLLRQYVDEIWRIPTDHFYRTRARVAAFRRVHPVPLERVLVERSDHSRSMLKCRLFGSELKSRHCELCGQSDTWPGRRTALILDHIKVKRPPYEQLLADLDTMSFVAVGRKYGVSDNAVRKWLRWYENQAGRERSEAERRAA